jgi:inner membrane transporter RhtA
LRDSTDSRCCEKIESSRQIGFDTVPGSSSFKPFSIALPISALLVAMVSFQVGAAVANQLFAILGAPGTVAARLGLASLMLCIVWRPWRMRPSLREVRAIVLYGLAMGGMNFFFYLSLSRIPLGTAVAFEFTGPLAVAMVASRRPMDFLWVALALLGLAALLPLGHMAKPLAPAGIAFALAAAICWAMYIVFGQKAGNLHGGQTTALGTLVAAIFIVPIGLMQVGPALFAPAVLPAACTIALLSSAVPYTLEMYALTRVPTRSFGVLMSLDPAVAALSGLIFLSERLSAVQWAAIVCIMLASAGSAATSRRASLLPLPD